MLAFNNLDVDADKNCSKNNTSPLIAWGRHKYIPVLTKLFGDAYEVAFLATPVLFRCDLDKSGIYIKCDYQIF